MDAIASRLEVITSRLEAFATRLEAIAVRLVEVSAIRLEAIAIRLEAIASRFESIASRVLPSPLRFIHLDHPSHHRRGCEGRRWWRQLRVRMCRMSYDPAWPFWSPRRK